MRDATAAILQLTTFTFMITDTPDKPAVGSFYKDHIGFEQKKMAE